jgi:hypothetical protein
MTYLTENPWPLMIVLLGAGLVCLFALSGSGRMGAIACGLLAAGVYLVEGIIVTPAEHIEQEVHTMLDSFKRSDLPAISQQISDENPGLKDIAEQGLQLVQLKSDFHVKSVAVEMSDDGTSATAKVRANGNVRLKSNGYERRIPEFWETKWKDEAGVWRMTDAIRLNPVNGERIGYFDRQ